MTPPKRGVLKNPLSRRGVLFYSKSINHSSRNLCTIHLSNSFFMNHIVYILEFFAIGNNIPLVFNLRMLYVIFVFCVPSGNVFVRSSNLTIVLFAAVFNISSSNLSI